ncbi:MAG: hypothetical protein ACRES7_09195 [Gammaproteobacteria bacterium]
MNALYESIPVNAGALAAMRKTRGWVLFLGVLCVIAAVLLGIMVLAGLFMLRVNLLFGLVWLIEGGIFLVVSLLYAVWLIGYAGALRRANGENDAANAALELALILQKRLWTLTGVILLVGIALGVAAAIFFTFWGHQFLTALSAYQPSG